LVTLLNEELLAALGVLVFLTGGGATVDARLLVAGKDLLRVGADAVTVVVLVGAGRAALGAAVVPGRDRALVNTGLSVVGELLP
jgi:hypothetical protein